MTARYSSRVEEMVWNVAVIFQGLLDTYIRGESKIDQNGSQRESMKGRLMPDIKGAPKNAASHQIHANTMWGEDNEMKDTRTIRNPIALS